MFVYSSFFVGKDCRGNLNLAFNLIMPIAVQVTRCCTGFGALYHPNFLNFANLLIITLVTQPDCR